jgi:hypothetical protein
MKSQKHWVVATVALVAALAAAQSADAQQVERVEAKFAVTGSSVQGIAEGQVIRLDAEEPATKLAFPTFVKVKLFGTNLDIQSSFYVIRGRVGESSIPGVAPNATLECRVNLATVSCVLSDQNGDTGPQFGGDVLRLHVVEK